MPFHGVCALDTGMTVLIVDEERLGVLLREQADCHDGERHHFFGVLRVVRRVGRLRHGAVSVGAGCSCCCARNAEQPQDLLRDRF